MSPITSRPLGSPPDAADATKGLLDLAHAALPSAELGGVLTGARRAAAALLEPPPPGRPARGPSPPPESVLSAPARSHLAAIEESLSAAVGRHGAHTLAACRLRRAVETHAEDVAARPRGAAVPPWPSACVTPGSPRPARQAA